MKQKANEEINENVAEKTVASDSLNSDNLTIISSENPTSAKTDNKNSKETEESLVKWVDDMLVSDEADYLMRSLDQMVMGSYTDNVTLGGTVGQVAMGFFGADIIADIRDLTHTLSNWEGTKSDVVDLLFNTMACIPIIGVLKNTKSVAKLVDDLSTISKVTKTVPTKVKYGEQFTTGIRGRKELKPNIEYTSPQGYTYVTNTSGNIESATGTLTKNTATRNTYSQRVVGREDRLKNDDGGHLIASIFDGSGDLDNLVPMDSTLNRSDWKKMENKWSDALENNETVEVDIKINYIGDSKRPNSFDVTYIINGEGKVENFKNY